MLDSFRSNLTFANVASALALFMAIGGGSAVAVGAIGGSDGTIKACYVKKGKARKGTSTGEVQVLLKGSKCDKGEVAFTFNTRGVPGAQGSPGVNGANGLNGTARAYGRVSGQGVVDTTRSTPGISVVRQLEGLYCVKVPGLTPANLFIVPAVDFSYPDSLGGDTALANTTSSCGGGDGFQVATFDSNSTTIEEDAGFVFVIP